jgi:hypothetical protein
MKAMALGRAHTSIEEGIGVLWVSIQERIDSWDW